MFNIQLKEVHVGKAILERLEKLDMSKSEFGRRIGVPQQHVNRIFEKEYIDTRKLIKICRALEFNFFSLFCEFPTQVEAHLSAVALGDGDAHNNIGESAVLTEMESYKQAVQNAKVNEARMQEQIDILKNNLRDKEEIINLLKERKN